MLRKLSQNKVNSAGGQVGVCCGDCSGIDPAADDAPPPPSRATFECPVMHVRHIHGQLDAAPTHAPLLNAPS